MRIVLTVHQFLPDYSSGTEILTFETAYRLKELGHDVVVFTGFPDTDPLSDSERFDSYTYKGIEVHRFHHGHMPMGGQTNIMEMLDNNRLVSVYFKEFLKNIKPHLVHFFHLARLSASPIDVCVELGIPTVFTPTDFWFICPTSQLRLPDNQICKGPEKYGVNCLKHLLDNSKPTGLKAWIQLIPDRILSLLICSVRSGVKLDKRFTPAVRALSERYDFLVKKMNEIDIITVPSNIMEMRLTAHGLSRQKIISIPFGLNLTYFNAENRPKLSEVFRIGYMGALSEHKGVHVLLEAVRNLYDTPLELVIYGKLDDDPQYVERLKKITANDSRIKFLGTFPNHQIGSIFSRMDALVIPSLWLENTPLVLYSAQAAKCPVIASNVPGISEVIEHGENGLLFEAGDVVELEKIILDLMADHEVLKTLSDNARVPLSIEAYVDKLLDIYKRLLLTEN